MAGLSLLCIDNDPILGRFVRSELGSRGFAITVAENAAAALEALRGGGFEVVALGDVMPGRTDLALLDAISTLQPAPSVIVLTGPGDWPAALSALRRGAADWVVKDLGPVFIDALETAAHAAVSHGRRRRDKEASDREVRAARDRFEALAAERQILLHEVNHRVGNSLQLVGAFLHMQAHASSTPETRQALDEANRRVIAIAQVHRRLYATDDVQAVALGHYLETLVEDIRQSTDGEEVGELLSFSADDVQVDPDNAVTIGIIVTELVINATKYAYPGSSGPIRVVLQRLAAPGTFGLAVEDDGVGRPERARSPTGIGKTIISAMASKLDTVVDYDVTATGTRASMTFDVKPPLPPRGRAEDNDLKPDPAGNPNAGNRAERRGSDRIRVVFTTRSNFKLSRSNRVGDGDGRHALFRRQSGCAAQPYRRPVHTPGLSRPAVQFRGVLQCAVQGA